MEPTRRLVKSGLVTHNQVRVLVGQQLLKRFAEIELVRRLDSDQLPFRKGRRRTPVGETSPDQLLELPHILHQVDRRFVTEAVVQ